MNRKPTHRIAEYYGSEQYQEAIKAAKTFIIAVEKYQRGIKNEEPAEALMLRQIEISGKIADVEILLDQIKYLLSSTAEVTRLKDKKLQHQLGVIEKEGQPL